MHMLNKFPVIRQFHSFVQVNWNMIYVILQVQVIGGNVYSNYFYL